MMFTVAGLAILGFDGGAMAAPVGEQIEMFEWLCPNLMRDCSNDLGKFHAVTTADFYAYDNGMRFDGDALMQAIQKQHAAGYVYE